MPVVFIGTIRFGYFLGTCAREPFGRGSTLNRSPSRCGRCSFELESQQSDHTMEGDTLSTPPVKLSAPPTIFRDLRPHGTRRDSETRAERMDKLPGIKQTQPVCLMCGGSRGGSGGFLNSLFSNCQTSIDESYDVPSSCLPRKTRCLLLCLRRYN